MLTFAQPLIIKLWIEVCNCIKITVGKKISSHCCFGFVRLFRCFVLGKFCSKALPSSAMSPKVKSQLGPSHHVIYSSIGFR